MRSEGPLWPPTAWGKRGAQAIKAKLFFSKIVPGGGILVNPVISPKAAHIVMISGMWAPVFELTHTNAVADLLMLINSETEDMDVVTSISLSNLFRYNRKWL